MATKRITAAVVEAMVPGAVVFDTEARGFMVRHRGGVPRYALKTRIKGRQAILAIGQHARGHYGPERARKEAIRLLGLIRDGRDIAADRAAERSAPTLASFADRYLSEFASSHHKPRTVAEERRLLALHILPALGSVRLRDIGRADVARLHSGMQATPLLVPFQRERLHRAAKALMSLRFGGEYPIFADTVRLPLLVHNRLMRFQTAPGTRGHVLIGRVRPLCPSHGGLSKEWPIAVVADATSLPL